MTALAATAIFTATGAASAAHIRADSNQATSTTTWSLVGTVDPQHVYSAKTELVLQGAYVFDPSWVSFNPQQIPASVPQLVVPYVLVPDGNPHTYRLRFHLNTSGTMSSQYKLTDTYGYSSTVTVPAGDTTVDFIVPVQFAGAGWEYMVLRNLSGTIWVFYSCEIDEQTS